MEKSIKLPILGVEYCCDVHSPDSEALAEADGRCDFWARRILVSDCSDWSPEDSREYFSQILRHEIIHAYLFESGLAYNSSDSTHWAMNEEMVDWLAIQIPKIMKTFEKAQALLEDV